MNAIIIDDEKPARDSLKTVLKLHFPMVNIVGEADSVKSGIEVLSEKRLDVLFLDINLSDGSGFAILEALRTIDFQIIFVTAYNDFAIKAFRVNALDYILKPIQISDISEALKRAEKQMAKLSHEDLELLKRNANSGVGEQRIIIREMNGTRYVNIKDIMRCQAHINYTKIHLKDGSKVMTSRTLKEFANVLEEFGFFRTHQSHLVKVSAIRKITKDDGLYVEIENGELVALSRRKKEALVNRIEGINL